MSGRFFHPCVRKERTKRMARKASPQTAQPSMLSVEVCPQCQEFVGRSYPHCAACRDVAEQPIKPAWLALLQARNIAQATLPEHQLPAPGLAQRNRAWG